MEQELSLVKRRIDTRFFMIDGVTKIMFSFLPMLLLKHC